MRFVVVSALGERGVDVTPTHLVIAGWTGRDTAVLEAHIEELAALGVARPKSVPMFYRVAASLLTQAEWIQVAGRDGSGEVEAVLVKVDGNLFVGVGSDHTDRKLEAVGVTLSKQVCAKPVSTHLWEWAEVVDHWDEIVANSKIEDGIPYQQGKVAALRRPDDLWALYESRHGPLPDGSIMFCGTLPVMGQIRFAEAMEISLADPRLGRALRHRYVIDALPIVEA